MSQIFQSLDEFRQILSTAASADLSAQVAASARNGQLTKPPGALGRLEDLAIWFASWQGNAKPKLRFPQVLIFAGNHGVMAQGVSAFPAEVTEQMVLNFQHGGAAINQLSRTFGAQMAVHALSLETPTADFTQAPAMTEAELLEALQTGWDAVNPNADAGLENKTRVVAEAVALHGGQGDGLEMLRRLGGRELAAMAGAMARARVERIPVLLDGFICCAAAATLKAVNAKALDHAVAGHVSAEAAHGKLLEQLGKEPLLALGLRLGEGSGAALAIGVLQGAIACHSGMATFAEAGVSDG
jgi:nicotinate-nucleotide--dimethylbenzimidazole phosphoribosyltransferase